jgi:hypothetical protein
VENCGKVFGDQRRPTRIHVHGLVSGFLTAGGLLEPPVQACSACAGDYEDPDRTAWAANEPEEAPDECGEGDAPHLPARGNDEFPADET